MTHSLLSALGSMRRFTPRLVSLLPTTLLAIVALLAGLAPALLLATVSSAEGRATSETAAVHAVRLDSPAVVRIITVYSGKVICVGCAQSSDVTFPLDGSSYVVDGSGSGTLISPDGYILTADHVVDVYDAVDQYMLNEAISELAKSQNISLDQATQAFQAVASQIRYSVDVTGRTAFLSTAYIGAVHDASQVSDPQTAFPITRIVASSPVDKQDVAIVKVEGHDLPNVRLAPSGGPQVQDSVTAIAFPADADASGSAFLELLNPKQGNEMGLNNLLTPTVESGQITAVKRGPDGTPYYQTTDIGNHGSSGGAVISDRGEIVGVMDAVAYDNTPRVNWLVTNDVIASYVQQAGVTNSGQGTFMTRWARALNALDSGDPCQAVSARDSLRQLAADYPRFGAIQPFVKEAEDSATGAHCGPSAVMVAGMSGLVVLLLGAAAGVLFFLHRRGTLTLPLPAARRTGAPGSPAPQQARAPLAAPIAAGALPFYGAQASAPQSWGYPTPPYPVPNAAHYTPRPADLDATSAMPTPAKPAPSYSLSSYPTLRPSGVIVPPVGSAAPGFATTQRGMQAVSRPMPQEPATIAPRTFAPRTFAQQAAVTDSDPTRGCEVRRCVNGHSVMDAVTRLCPECGGRVFF